jgi:hypothetical protein
MSDVMLLATSVLDLAAALLCLVVLRTADRNLRRADLAPH